MSQRERMPLGIRLTVIVGNSPFAGPQEKE
jgi:hypothetical protein